jgi:hypothetical protein
MNTITKDHHKSPKVHELAHESHELAHTHTHEDSQLMIPAHTHDHEIPSS